jgi:hypothetical protein
MDCRNLRVTIRLSLFVTLFPVLSVLGQTAPDPISPGASSLTAIQKETPPAECQRRTAEDFIPMTRTDREVEYIRGLVGPMAFVYSAAQAGLGQALDRPHEWGQGAEGFGLRMGSAYAAHVVGTTVTDGLAWALKEDNRYFDSGERTFGRRLRYALTSALLARREDGSRTFSFSAVGGGAGGAFISRAWQPRSTASAGDGAVAFGLGMAFRAGANVVHEFAPRSIRRFLP